MARGHGGGFVLLAVLVTAAIGFIWLTQFRQTSGTILGFQVL